MRFLWEEKELKEWNPEKFPEKFTVTVQLAPCIHELLKSGVRVSYISGEAVDYHMEASPAQLVGIQDLREAIAGSKKIRATAVSLITNSGKSLWHSQPFDLCDLGCDDSITVCIRDPELCAQGQHEIMCFSNNGYNDQICIHCGSESYMEGRMREPRRHGWS